MATTASGAVMLRAEGSFRVEEGRKGLKGEGHWQRERVMENGRMRERERDNKRVIEKIVGKIRQQLEGRNNPRSGGTEKKEKRNE